MPRLPLERVEELVEDSVFHPSPCKRHRERVLKNAVQAAVRQKISHRMMAAVAAGVLVLGLGIVIVRVATSSGEAVSEASAPSSATAGEASSAAPATQPSTSGSTGAGSMGEGLYRSSNPDGQPSGL
jgi:hypothetical protein